VTRATQSINRYEGWKSYAETPLRTQPDTLTRTQMARLSPEAKRSYDRTRREWHANILLRTRQVEELESQLDDIVESNLQDAGRVKSAAAIDAPPTLGKSTLVNYYGRRFHQQQLEELGEYLDDGDTLHLPVCHVTLEGKVTIKGLHEALLGFYAHPSAGSRIFSDMRGRELARAAAECVERHSTRLIIIDDLHFLNLRTRDGVEVANQLKWLANEYDATFLFTGVALRKRGIIAEGETGRQAAMAQTFRRWTVFGMSSFSLRTKAGRTEWMRLIATIEQRIALAEAHHGMLTEQAEYLFARSSGNIGSLMDLIRRGASRAIRTGRETLDRELLESIRLDEGAETERAEHEARLRRRAPRTQNATDGEAAA
jgi:hypothetical protein